MRTGNLVLEPQDALDLPQYHLVHDSTHPSVKEVILKCFISSSVPIRIVICSIAFGMGVNPPDMRRIIHFGSQHSVVDYIQGIGRCGRDGKKDHTLLLWEKVSDVIFKMKLLCIATILKIDSEMYFLMILIVTPIARLL